MVTGLAAPASPASWISFAVGTDGAAGDGGTPAGDGGSAVAGLSGVGVSGPSLPDWVPRLPNIAFPHSGRLVPAQPGNQRVEHAPLLALDLGPAGDRSGNG